MVSSTLGPLAAAVVAAPEAGVAPEATLVAAPGTLVLVPSPQAASTKLNINSKIVKTLFFLESILFSSFTPNFFAGGSDSTLKS